MKIDGSATRPVTTICAPALSASTIGSAPRYASAEIRVGASVDVGLPFSMIVSVSSSTRSVIRLPPTAATLTPRLPNSRSQCAMRSAAPSGLIQPWFETIRVPRRRHAGSTAFIRSSR